MRNRAELMEMAYDILDRRHQTKPMEGSWRYFLSDCLTVSKALLPK
jgi:hypothetical protein